eukprot:gnl/MRDRNA2_/MRDRNA2_86718_c1_seq1.p1 gnl/MRDRNA2_/MRDRNA2_86718_c1~~gnl/MRDRNA2_/MRDRNA2_86718_c1_seq1.p1  ORF type:complete len:476 (+),score=-24.53 gnl/MRDRNA2_/MRDRNA2_86718_c1_seq1:220-1647(+)
MSKLEREMINHQYLGIQKERKRIAHPSERMRFIFEWDIEEDTSRDLNPLYDRPATLTMLFSRGMRGGIDRAEQQKNNSLNAKKCRDEIMQRKESIKLTEKRFGVTKMKIKERKVSNDPLFCAGYCVFKKYQYQIDPMITWNEYPLTLGSRKALISSGYKYPILTQSVTIPLIQDLNYVINLTKNGSGQVLSYLLCVLSRFSMMSSMKPIQRTYMKRTYAMILSSSRESSTYITYKAKKHILSARIESRKVISSCKECNEKYQIISITLKQWILLETKFRLKLDRFFSVVLDYGDSIEDSNTISLEEKIKESGNQRIKTGHVTINPMQMYVNSTSKIVWKLTNVIPWNLLLFKDLSTNKQMNNITDSWILTNSREKILFLISHTIASYSHTVIFNEPNKLGSRKIYQAKEANDIQYKHSLFGDPKEYICQPIKKIDGIKTMIVKVCIKPLMEKQCWVVKNNKDNKFYPTTVLCFHG